MQHSHRRLAVVLILAALQAAACAQQQSDMSSQSKPAEVGPLQETNVSRVTLPTKAAERLDIEAAGPASVPDQSKPSKIERVQGSEVSRVTLSRKAAERLDIQTAPVREEQLGPRKRLVGGEVVAGPAVAAADGSKVWVKVSLPEGDLRTVVPGHPARVVPLARDADGKAGMTARAVTGDGNAKEPALHYAIDSADGLAPGQRVRVELALNGAGTRKVVPHAAVIYDAKGKAWVYANTEALTFVRQPITIDYVEGNLAVLSDGPAAGTKVVTVGAAELLGTEFGK